MSDAGQSFIAAFGAPDPATPDGLKLARGGTRSVWAELHSEIGAGWFRDGFLYLFGEGVDRLQTCLDAWSFVVPPGKKRTILGRNAYGAILVLENEGEPGAERGYLLDPFVVAYTEIPNTRFVSIISRALPKNETGPFLDAAAYADWCEENAIDRIGVKDVLGIKVPRGLGGKLEASNLQLDDIENYYRTTAPIYADAFARAGAAWCLSGG